MYYNGGFSNFYQLLFIKSKMDVAQNSEDLVTRYARQSHQIFLICITYSSFWDIAIILLLLCYEDM